MTIGQDIAQHGHAIGELLARLTPDELVEIAEYPWSESFAWFDEKAYREQAPLVIQGEPLEHPLARLVWLQAMEILDSASFDLRLEHPGAPIT